MNCPECGCGQYAKHSPDCVHGKVETIYLDTESHSFILGWMGNYWVGHTINELSTIVLAAQNLARVRGVRQNR